MTDSLQSAWAITKYMYIFSEIHSLLTHLKSLHDRIWLFVIQMVYMWFADVFVEKNTNTDS